MNKKRGGGRGKRSAAGRSRHHTLPCLTRLEFCAGEQEQGEYDMHRDRQRGALTVETSQRRQSSRLERPRSQGSCDGELSRMQVVIKAGNEANVRVDDEGKGNRGVEDSTGAVLDCTGSKEGHEGNRDGALKGPVVRAVRRVGVGECGRVVDCALDVG